MLHSVLHGVRPAVQSIMSDILSVKIATHLSNFCDTHPASDTTASEDWVSIHVTLQACLGETVLETTELCYLGWN